MWRAVAAPSTTAKVSIQFLIELLLLEASPSVSSQLTILPLFFIGLALAQDCVRLKPLAVAFKDGAAFLRKAARGVVRDADFILAYRRLNFRHFVGNPDFRTLD